MGAGLRYRVHLGGQYIMSSSELAGGERSGPRIIVTPFELRDYMLLLRWLIVASLIVVALFAVFQTGLFRTMIAVDRTYLSSLVVLVFLGATIHCGFATVAASRELNTARRVARAIRKNPASFRLTENGEVALNDGSTLLAGFITDHIRNVIIKARNPSDEPLDHTMLMHALADTLRGRLQVGVFIVDALPKIGLVGTVIGFILMLAPIRGIDSFDPLTLRAAMADMSSGMATALSVTLTALIGSIILKLQYYFLEIGTIELHSIIAETTDMYVVPALQTE
ncbi:MAG: biopolymer transporter ExbB [Alphaproteobacteria bacterium]|nr:biopolymer transporter ExbB [Alphaproteobacteria bacterium]